MTPIEELCETIYTMILIDDFYSEASVKGMAMLKKYAPGKWAAIVEYMNASNA